MNCKSCGNLIDKDANFCPYCGETIKKEEKKYEYDDPFKDLRIDTTHAGQYQYQQDYSNKNKNKYQNDFEYKKPTIKVNKSLIGLILGIASIVICFINHCALIGIGIALIAFILTIIGFRQTTKGFGIISIIITIFTFLTTLVISSVVFVGSLEITFTNGDTTTIKNYLTDAFFCGYNEHRLTGYWLDDSNELLYLDDEGNYYIYLNADELTDNYYYGTYEIEDGWDIGNEEIIFTSGDYYLYQMNTMFNKSKMEGTVYYETIDLIENGFTLKLDKENKNHLVLICDDGETVIEFKKK